MHAMRFSVALTGCLVGAATLHGESAGGRGVTSEDFAEVKTLKEAVEVILGSLKLDGKPEYAALISEARVREAVRSAVRSYEALLPDLEKRRPGSKDYFLKEVKPVCLKIADNGEWPPRCSFFSFYTLTQRREREDIVYSGLGLRLRIETPGAKSEAFALPIVDLYYGRFSE